MGNSATHLPYPITSKYIQRRSTHGGKLRVGSSEMQGFRLHMEDALDIKLPKEKGESEEESAYNKLSYFGVFDGHGGEKASNFTAERLHHILFSSDDPKKPANIMAAVLKVDEEFLLKKNDRKQGTTAVFAIVEPLPESEQKKKKNEGGFKVTVGNLGDSRALLVRSTGRFLPLTKDHKPDNFLEKQRVEAAGGSVSFHRVDGDLAVSRAIGDWTFKNATDRKVDEQKVIAVPEVTVAIARPGDSLLLCCDGLFERLTSKQVAGFIYREVTSERQPEEYLDPADIAARLLELSLRCGSGDNMSAVLVCFMPDKDPVVGEAGPGLGPPPAISQTSSQEPEMQPDSQSSTDSSASSSSSTTSPPSPSLSSVRAESQRVLTTDSSGTSSAPPDDKVTGTPGSGAGGLIADADMKGPAVQRKKKWDTLPSNEYVPGQVPPKANRLYMQAYRNDAQKCKSRLS